MARRSGRAALGRWSRKADGSHEVPNRAKPEEAEAARLFKDVTGITLQKNDDGSRNGLVDFLFDHPPPGGAVEVTTYTDPLGYQASVEWGKSQREIFVAQELQHSWLATVEERTQFKGLAQRIAPALQALEDADLSSFSDEWQWNPGLGALEGPFRLLVTNGVTDAEVVEIKPPLGQVHIAPAGSAMAGHANDALTELETYFASVAMADVRGKLGASGRTERHAFIWVDLFNKFSAARPILEADHPDRPPALPAEITHLWAVVRQGTGWRWGPSWGWQRFTFSVPGPQAAPRL